MKLILASASPRRAEILREAGVPFAVMSSAVDETVYPGEAPINLVQRLADAKADLVAARAVGPVIVIAADTVVVLEGQVLGKPRSTDDARHMLAGRAGRYIPRIEGCYFNVVGLPLAHLLSTLRELGWSEHDS